MAVQAQPQFPFCGSQDWMDNNANACGGALNQFYSSYLHQHQQQQQLQCNSHLFNTTSSSAPKIEKHSSFPHPQLQSMAAYEDKQSQEVDHYIKLQNERLRLLMQEQRKQQIALLMKKIESKALPLLRKKDEEIAQAAKRTVELQDLLKRLEMENQVWQRAAHENEAMVVSLNNTIEQIREKAATYCFDNGAEDAESCCDVINREDDEQSNRVVGVVDDNNNLTQEKEKKKLMMVCRGCNSRNSCILFLPCRHLCSCKPCEPFLDSCPVCLTGKKATLEALIV
ncbi:probable BOI-related E3 ubiquitin-protein ligase 2 [Euphorbia lathyris]|uniref:probable BOI-related E3 ubiquitin-protein ligase 2 n=1 Tax=Euphorbia lathyris TaxID=212925 RepID=UPI003314086A